MINLKRTFYLLIGIAAFTNVSAQKGLHPDRGVAMIWYGGQNNLDSRDGIVTVGQIFFMWRSFESTKDNYDFESLNRQLEDIHNKGMKTTIQVNGNKHPDYIFQIVPYLDGVALPTQKNHTPEIGYGPPMYWHPTYKQRYKKMIDTLAYHVKNSPWKDAVLGIRHSFNAVGTEHHHIPPEYREKAAWTFEAGVTEDGDFPWSSEIADTYKKWTIDMYVDAFNPPENINVFIRANAVSGGLLNERQLKLVEKGDLWIFHTSSEPQPRGGKISQYQVFVDYVKTGKTYAFMESWAKARSEPGDDSWIKTEKPITVEQCNYWTLLVDLHCGATWPAMRIEDIDKPAFREQFEFAAKYAGYAAAPKESPGAWIAFREGDNMAGDYTFFMTRAAGDKSQPLYNVDDAPEGLWARRVAAGDSMELEMDPEFANSLYNNRDVKLSITYKDVGTGDFEIEAFGKNFNRSLTRTGQWLTFTEKIIVDEIADMRISAGNSPLTLHKVEVERGIVNEGGDIKAPSTPSNLKIENVTKYTCELKWDASIDAVGVTGYLVYRNNELITTVTSTNTSILNLNCGTSCNFSVKATDAAGNISESSNTVIAETLACPDSITSYQLVYDEDFEDNLAQDWLASPEDKWSISEGKYKTVKGGSFNSIYEGRQFQNYKLLAEANPSYGNNYGIIFNYIDANNYYMLELDASPTTVELVKFENGSKSIVASSTYNEGGLNFNNSIEIVHAFSKVTITVNGIEIFNDIDITSADSSKIGLYVFYNPVSFDNIQVYESTTGADTTAPSIPTEITASGITETSLDLSWAASTDSSGVAGYNIYKNGVLEKTVTGNETSITGLACGSTYPFTIVAVDVNGNSPDASEPVSFSTSPCSDIVDPDGPTALSVTGIGAYSLELNWTASTDNVGVRAYQVYIDNEFETAFFTTSATLYGLTCETDYTISIRAEDFSGNLSEAAEIEVSTADCTDDVPPLAPANLRAYNTTQTSTELTWLISSDNYGVTSYEVYLDDRHHTSVTTTWTEITGLKCDSTYQFTVKAKDAAGNLSEAGDTIEVVTGECIVNSIGNNFSLQNVSIYPVPFKHELTVRFDGVVGNCRIKVYDMPGSIVYAEHFYSAGNNLLKVGQNLAEGFYLIKIETDDSAITHRIIKKNNN
jgi:chitodextrinase